MAGRGLAKQSSKSGTNFETMMTSNPREIQHAPGRLMMKDRGIKPGRHLLAALKLLLAAFVISISTTTARAQSPTPSGGGDFAGEMAQLVQKAAELVPLIRDQVESPL